MIIRKASAVWNGSGKEGSGHLTSPSGVLNNTPYSFHDRFENGNGTNPEELVAAAHAGCFSMKLSFILGAAGFIPESLATKCEINFEGGVLLKSHLTVEGKVPGITKEQFETCVKEAEKTCPISNALKLEISSTGILL